MEEHIKRYKGEKINNADLKEELIPKEKPETNTNNNDNKAKAQNVYNQLSQNNFNPPNFYNNNINPNNPVPNYIPNDNKNIDGEKDQLIVPQYSNNAHLLNDNYLTNEHLKNRNAEYKESGSFFTGVNCCLGVTTIVIYAIISWVIFMYR